MNDMLFIMIFIFAYLHGAYIVFSVFPCYCRNLDRPLPGMVATFGFIFVLISFLFNSFLIYKVFFAFSDESGWLLLFASPVSVIAVLAGRIMLGSTSSLKRERIVSAVFFIVSLTAAFLLLG